MGFVPLTVEFRDGEKPTQEQFEQYRQYLLSAMASSYLGRRYLRRHPELAQPASGHRIEMP